jgi:hypothetical protein
MYAEYFVTKSEGEHALTPLILTARPKLATPLALQIVVVIAVCLNDRIPIAEQRRSKNGLNSLPLLPRKRQHGLLGCLWILLITATQSLQAVWKTRQTQHG